MEEMSMTVAAAAEDQPLTETRLPEEINWEMLDKPRFFVLSVVLYSGVSAVVYPATVIKTLLQVSDNPLSPVNAATAIIRHEGPRGLYRGFSTALTGTIPARALYITTLEATKSSAIAATGRLGLPEAVTGPAANAVAGFSAGVAAQFVWTPTDVVSQRIMVQGTAGASPSSKYHSGIHAFRNILRSEGLCGLYRGFGLSIFINAPSSAVWWTSYSVSQKIIWGGIGDWASRRDTAVGVFRPGDGTVVVVQTVSGAMAGAAATVVTMPLDTTKTRMQVMDGGGNGATGLTAIRTMKGLFRAGVWMACYRGLGPRLASMLLTSAAMSTTYELLKRLSVKNLEGFT